MKGRWFFVPDKEKNENDGCGCLTLLALVVAAWIIAIGIDYVCSNCFSISVDFWETYKWTFLVGIGLTDFFVIREIITGGGDEKSAEWSIVITQIMVLLGLLAWWYINR